MLQSYLLLHGANCSTFRKDKKTKQLLFFSSLKGTKICYVHIYPTHLTYFIYKKDEELIACGSY